MADERNPQAANRGDVRRDPNQRGTATAAGQDKTYQVRNPSTGETRTVTQREWREQRLGQLGFEKPADMPEDQPA
jgi:hypothetical protein